MSPARRNRCSAFHVPASFTSDVQVDTDLIRQRPPVVMEPSERILGAFVGTVRCQKHEKPPAFYTIDTLAQLVVPVRVQLKRLASCYPDSEREMPVIRSVTAKEALGATQLPGVL